MFVLVFFFKQKTAYEVYQCDWSSDVCSSDLAELEHSLWALQSPENLKKHHKVFAERINYLRKAGSKVHVEAVKKWWEQKLKELKN